jgi:hypothetical protein
MSRQFLKPCGILALSIALLYSGVAWTMEACIRHDGHSDEDHHNSEALSQHTHPEDQSVPIIRCAWVTQQVGPAARMASAETHRSDKGLALHAAFLSDVGAAVLRNSLWLEALFRRILTFYLPIDFPRHLFLSVFQI